MQSLSAHGTLAGSQSSAHALWLLRRLRMSVIADIFQGCGEIHALTSGLRKTTGSRVQERSLLAAEIRKRGDDLSTTMLVDRQGAGGSIM